MEIFYYVSRICLIVVMVIWFKKIRLAKLKKIGYCGHDDMDMLKEII